MASGWSVLEPAVFGSVFGTQGKLLAALLTETTSAAPTPTIKALHTNPIHYHAPGPGILFFVAIMVQTSSFAQSLQGCRTGALFSCYGSEVLQKRALIRCCGPLQCPISPALHTAVSKTGQGPHSNRRVLADAAPGTGNKCFVPVRDTETPTLCSLGITSKSGKTLQNLLPHKQGWISLFPWGSGTRRHLTFSFALPQQFSQAPGHL